MTSRTPKPDYEKAAELAKAMRRGLDDLRSMPVAPGSHSHSSGLTDLAAYADLKSLPPLAKKGQMMSRIVRTARSMLRALLRPWLAVQTEFNQGVMAELNDLRRRVTALENASLRTTSHDEQAPGEVRDAMPVASHGHESDHNQAVS